MLIKKCYCKELISQIVHVQFVLIWFTNMTSSKRFLTRVNTKVLLRLLVFRARLNFQPKSFANWPLNWPIILIIIIHITDFCTLKLKLYINWVVSRYFMQQCVVFFPCLHVPLLLVAWVTSKAIDLPITLFFGDHTT